MKTRICLLILCMVVSDFSRPLFAWNKEGHMLTAALAYLTLKKDNPDAVKRVVALLEKHPAFGQPIVGYTSASKPGQTWAEFTQSLTGDDRDMALFMLAARWADDAKDYPNPFHPLYYKKSGPMQGIKAWHYINYVYKPKTNTLSASPVEGPNILNGWQIQEALVKTGADSNRAKALCWMMHLMGDIHQPLHTVAMFTDSLPEGDQGGNLLWVKRPRQGRERKDQTCKLHEFWDNNYFDRSRMDGLFEAVKAQALAMVANPALAKARFPKLKTNKTPESWARKETAVLAQKFAYSNGKLKYSLDETTAVLLPTAYVTKATEVQEKQLVLAGLRMAGWLGKGL